MRTFKEVQVPAKTHKVEDSIVCDLCGRIAPGDIDWEGNMDHSVGTTVELVDTNSWPGTGDSTTTSFDICPNCFRDKVVPFLEGLGATSTTTEHDW